MKVTVQVVGTPATSDSVSEKKRRQVVFPISKDTEEKGKEQLTEHTSEVKILKVETPD